MLLVEAVDRQKGIPASRAQRARMGSPCGRTMPVRPMGAIAKGLFQRWPKGGDALVPFGYRPQGMGQQQGPFEGVHIVEDQPRQDPPCRAPEILIAVAAFGDPLLARGHVGQ